jgi:hypothetical protein
MDLEVKIKWRLIWILEASADLIYFPISASFSSNMTPSRTSSSKDGNVACPCHCSNVQITSKLSSLQRLSRIDRRRKLIGA